MLQKLRARLDRNEEGFTLIELMVVVLIIAILLAIAIPTFLGAREKAQDRAAQSDARNALTAAKTYYVDNQKYVSAPDTDLQGIEPSLKMLATLPGTNPHEVQVLATADGTTVCVTTKSASGKFFEVKDIATGTGAGTTFDKPTAALASCDSTPLTGKW